MNQIWKDVVDYVGLYQVSNWGRAKSLNYHRTGKEQILKQIIDDKGHVCVHLCKNGHSKPVRINRMVFEAFYRRLLPNEVVHHLSEVKTQNNVENLVAWDNFRHLSYHHKGNKNRLGKHHTEQSKTKISQTRRLKKLIDPNYGKRKK